MPSTGEESRRPNRGRAAGPENRRALIAAAREVWTTDGADAPFSAVAKRAGVGQGSLYRHFPDRTALAVAVFEENITALEEATARVGCTIDDLLDRVVDQAIVSTALIDLITAHLDDPLVQHLGERFVGVIALVASRERAAGRLGVHIEDADVMMAAGMLATELARTAPEQRPAAAHRARALFRAAFAPR